MSPAPRRTQLSPRDFDVLQDVIYTYVVLGEPVSSRTVSKSDRHGLSSASLRNIMADLEEHGLLRQTHSSSGRIPTAAGYHMFIDTLMPHRSVPAKARQYIESNLAEGQDADERVSRASHLLSELSQQVGIVLVPALDETVLKAIEFVPLSGRKVLCVIISSSGFVDNKLVELDDPVSREELIEAANFLNERFGGKSMREIRDELLVGMEEDRARVDQMLQLVIQLARTSFGEGDGPDIVLDGTEGVLGLPELSDLGRARRFFETFKDKARLVGLLNRCIEGGGVRVWIEEDCELTSELGLGIVATPYGIGERNLGSVGIVGPSRMAYERVIPLVEYLAESLGRALETTFEI